LTRDINDEAKNREMEGRERCIVGMLEKGANHSVTGDALATKKKVTTSKFQV